MNSGTFSERKRSWADWSFSIPSLWQWVISTQRLRGWVDTHYISSSTVLPREHLTSCHSDEHVQDQGKTHRKHGKAGFWDKLLHYYILWRISSLQRKCCPRCTVQHSHPRRVLPLLQGKQHRQRGREQGTSQTRGDHWFIAVRVEAQGLCTDSLKCSVPWKAGAACAKSLQSIR